MPKVGVDLKAVDPVFADAGSDLDTSDYVIFGVPFDATTSHRTGAAKAPGAIRFETYNFETYLMDINVELQNVDICDLGDLDIPNNYSEQIEALRRIELFTGSILDKGKIPMIMGGEHSITEASAEAFMQRYAREGGLVVILDAHLDFRDEYMGNPHSHACTARRIAEKWGTDSICLLGPRSASRDEMEDAERMGLKYASTRMIRSQGTLDILDQWDTGFCIKDRPIYLSIDIDCLDPSFAPGTGTPEPFGLSSFQVLSFLEGLYPHIIALDVVEVSPDIEPYITPGLAGKMMRHFIGLKEMKIDHPTWLEKV